MALKGTKIKSQLGVTTLSSDFFNSIRVKPRKKADEKPEGPICDWEDCDNPAEHKAPKGRKAEGEFYHYCTTHVREYNKNFNYFSEMKDDEVAAELKDNMQTGGRPTWQQSTNGSAARARTRGPKPRSDNAARFNDPLNLFARTARSRGEKKLNERELRMVAVDRRAFEDLGFDKRVSSDELKKRYKELVKTHHPDANGGDAASVDKFRSIIEAYKHLKEKGFVD